MPTVLTIRNIRVAIYTNDHPPPHVHAIRSGGGRAKFELNCPHGPVKLVEQIGFSPTEVGEIGGGIAERLAWIPAADIDSTSTSFERTILARKQQEFVMILGILFHFFRSCTGHA